MNFDIFHLIVSILNKKVVSRAIPNKIKNDRQLWKVASFHAQTSQLLMSTEMFAKLFLSIFLEKQVYTNGAQLSSRVNSDNNQTQMQFIVYSTENV